MLALFPFKKKKKSLLFSQFVYVLRDISKWKKLEICQ